MGLTAEPSAWYSWDFEIALDSRHLCTLDLAHFRDEARFEFQDDHYAIRRLSRRGPFVLEHDDTELMRAVKPSMWRRKLQMTVKGTPYELRPASVLGRRFALYQGVHEVGTVTPVTRLGRKLVANLPRTFSLLEQIFVLFLVIALWRRDAQASGAG